MWDYLNEFLFLTSRMKRKNEYARAVMWKKTSARTIFNSLCHTWISRFKWESPEKTIAPEVIEKTILFGTCVAFARMSPYRPNMQNVEDSERNVWLSGLVSAEDNFSHYAMPTRITITDYVGRVKGTFFPILKELEFDDVANCAIIRDNYINMVPILNVMYYTERLADIDSSIHACIRNILGTSIISCTEEQAKTVKATREAAEIGVPYVLKYDKIDPEQLPPQLMSTPGASDELKVLFEASDKVRADFLQSIGIRVNNEMDRRSGITPIEITENRQNIDVSINSFLDARKEGIEQCKKLGLELSVSTDSMESTISTYDAQGNLINMNGGNKNVVSNDSTSNSDDVS